MKILRNLCDLNTYRFYVLCVNLLTTHIMMVQGLEWSFRTFTPLPLKATGSKIEDFAMCFKFSSTVMYGLRAFKCTYSL